MPRKPSRPQDTANTDIVENREWLIKIRDIALKNDSPDWTIIVGLSHTIAWLYYLMELEKYIEELEKTK